jgi:hypothetical protein
MASSKDSARQQKELRGLLAELKALPEDWTIKIDSDWRVYYQSPPEEEDKAKGKKKTPPQTFYDHPTLGPLPDPWIVRLCTGPDGKRYPRYFNPKTKRFMKNDPRVDRRVLAKQRESRKGDTMEQAASYVRMKSTTDISIMKRQPISTVSLRDKFHIVKVIDSGEGEIGGMNGGVFVVKEKVQKPPERLMVEKR